jgi:hypothetical protein
MPLLQVPLTADSICAIRLALVIAADHTERRLEHAIEHSQPRRVDMLRNRLVEFEAATLDLQSSLEAFPILTGNQPPEIELEPDPQDFETEEEYLRCLDAYNARCEQRANEPAPTEVRAWLKKEGS